MEQDHRFIKRLVNPGMGNVAHSTLRWRSIKGYEVMNMIRKGQVQGIEKGDISGQVEYARSNFPSGCLVKAD